MNAYREYVRAGTDPERALLGCTMGTVGTVAMGSTSISAGTATATGFGEGVTGAAGAAGFGGGTTGTTAGGGVVVGTAAGGPSLDDATKKRYKYYAQWLKGRGGVM